MSGIRSFIYPAVMTAMICISWPCALENSGQADKEFAEYFQKAQINEQNQAYITAAEWYAKAAEVKPDEEVLLLAAENFLRCEEKNMFLKYCRMAAEYEEAGDRPWLMLGQYYLDSGDAGKASDILSGVPETSRTEAVDELLTKVNCSFHKGYKKFSDAKPFYSGYCAVSDGNCWGLADEDGDWVILPEYDDMGAFSTTEEIVPVSRDGRWFFVNEEEQVKYAPSEKYTWLGAMESGLAPFCCEGKYGYTDTEYSEKTEKYDYAGSFSEGVAAVEKDGKWALINDSLRNVTGYDYDEISVDRYGFCVRNGRITAVRNGETVYLDTSGSELNDEKNLTCGLAPVSCGEFQGYEDKNGDTVIEAFFEEVTEFNENGRALVKEDGWWKIITLDVFR